MQFVGKTEPWFVHGLVREIVSRRLKSTASKDIDIKTSFFRPRRQPLVRMTTIAAPVGLPNIDYNRLGIFMFCFERGDQRILGVDREDLGARPEPETHSVHGHGLFPVGITFFPSRLGGNGASGGSQRRKLGAVTRD